MSMASFWRCTWRARSAASGCVKSGEKHSSDEACPVSSITSRTRRGGIGPERRQEAVVVLDALAAERLGVAQPLEVVHAAGAQVVEVALGEDGNPWGHRVRKQDQESGHEAGVRSQEQESGVGSRELLSPES